MILAILSQIILGLKKGEREKTPAIRRLPYFQSIFKGAILFPVSLQHSRHHLHAEVKPRTFDLKPIMNHGLPKVIVS